MKLPLMLVVVLAAGSALGQEAEFDFDKFQQLLEVDKKRLRRDQFARCEAMAKRYEITVRVRLEKQISQLDVYCNLAESQVRRLDLATLGAARTVGKKFQKQVAATESTKDHGDALKTLVGLSDEMQSLLTHPERSSFWGKAVASTLTDAQRKTLADQRAARLTFQKRAWVLRAVNEIDSEALLMTEQRNRLLTKFQAWIDKNSIPTMQRGRRGAWKMFPEELVSDLVFPELDVKRQRMLISTAPHHLREKLAKANESNQTDKANATGN